MFRVYLVKVVWWDFFSGKFLALGKKKKLLCIKAYMFHQVTLLKMQKNTDENLSYQKTSMRQEGTAPAPRE